MMLRFSENVKQYQQKLERKHSKGKALGILSAKLGRSVYTMLEKNRSFDIDTFLKK